MPPVRAGARDGGGQFVTDLGGTQISTLMETLPGIAQVLRSPVADALVNLIRAACRLSSFQLSDAEEVLRYAVRRNLMSQEECDRVLAEAREASERRAERAAERAAERVKAKARRTAARAKRKTKVVHKAMVKRPAKAMKRPGKAK